MSKTIDVSYELKTPTSGEEYSPWHTGRVAVSVTVDDSADVNTVVKELDNVVKEAVFNSLGAEAVVTPSGVMLPKPPTPTTSRSGGSNGSASGSGSRAKPETLALISELPKFPFAGTTWVDYRPAKADGRVKPAHPDFKTLNNRKVTVGSRDTNSVWLQGKDGNLTAEGQQLVNAAAEFALQDTGLVSPA